MQRKVFLSSVAGSMLTIWLQGCGGGGGYSSPAPPPASGSSCGASGGDITGNHGHSLTILKADLDSTIDKTYSLTPSGDGHTHQVTFTVAALAALKGGMSVTVTSTVAVASGLYGGSHNHDVTATVMIATCA